MVSPDDIPSSHSESSGVPRDVLRSVLRKGDNARKLLATLAARLARLEALCASQLSANSSSPRGGDAFSELTRLAEQQQHWNARHEEQLADLQSQLSELLDAMRNGMSPAEPSRGQPASARAAESPASSHLNWEQAKKQLLAQLENDDHADSPDDAEALADISGNAPDLLAERDARIAELERRLAEYSQLTEEIDRDEIVRQERDKLRKLQAEWEEKLRKSEIEISIERAKLARERTRLEEQLRGTMPADNTSADAASDKATRGRWLARLGLTDE